MSYTIRMLCDGTLLVVMSVVWEYGVRRVYSVGSRLTGPSPSAVRARGVVAGETATFAVERTIRTRRRTRARALCVAWPVAAFQAMREREGKTKIARVWVFGLMNRADSRIEKNPRSVVARERRSEGRGQRPGRPATRVPFGRENDGDSDLVPRRHKQTARPRWNAHSPVAHRLRVKRDEPGLGERPAAGA